MCNLYNFTLNILGLQKLINVSSFRKRDIFIRINYCGESYKLSTIHNTSNSPSRCYSSIMIVSVEC